MSKEDIPVSRESKLVAELRAHSGTIVVVLLKELLSVKLDQYKDRLIAENSESVRGRAQECIDILKCLGNDLI